MISLKVRVGFKMINKKRFFQAIKDYNKELQKISKQKVIDSNLEQARIMVNQNNEIESLKKIILDYKLLVNIALTLLSLFMILVFSMNFDSGVVDIGDYYLLIGGVLTFLLNFPPILKNLLN